jgi:hypothetical protein
MELNEICSYCELHLLKCPKSDSKEWMCEGRYCNEAEEGYLEELKENEFMEIKPFKIKNLTEEKSKDNFVLPKYWYCKLTIESRDILNYWRRNIIKYSYFDCPDKYITNSGSGSWAREGGGWGVVGEVVITFQQFLSHVWNGKEYYESISEFTPNTFNIIENIFILPKKWCIKLSNQIIVDYCNKYGAMPPYHPYKGYAHFPHFDGCTTAESIQKEYTEITFEQFKKYVLKEDFDSHINLNLDMSKISINHEPISKSKERIKLFIEKTPLIIEEDERIIILNIRSVNKIKI